MKFNRLSNHLSLTVFNIKPRYTSHVISDSLVYRIDDTIDTMRIVDTLIRYTIRIAIRIVSFVRQKILWRP